MGASFSAFNQFGLPGLTSATTKQVYDNHFKNRNTSNFEEFHIAYVDFCKYFNSVMPGQDFDTPPRQKIEEFYTKKWKDLTGEDEKRDEFFKFMEENLEGSSVGSGIFITTGLAAPAVAVVGKRASGHIPYVKNMRLDLVPNVVFVPAFTLGAIVVTTAVQMSRKSADVAKTKDESK